jgi:hypothetical protein
MADRSSRAQQGGIAPVVRRVDPLGRSAFGVLCIAGMSLEAIPVLLVVGVVGGIGIWIDGNGDRAFWVWFGSWAAAAFATALFLAIAYVCWPLASDWITEWQGYVTALVIGAVGLGLMSFTVFITDWWLTFEIVVPLVVTFLIGFTIPGWFLGLASPELRTMRHRQKPSVRSR